MPLAVGGGRTPLEITDRDEAMGRIEVEQEAPVTGAHAEPGELAFQFLERARKGISTELIDGSEDEPLILSTLGHKFADVFLGLGARAGEIRSP